MISELICITTNSNQAKRLWLQVVGVEGYVTLLYELDNVAVFRDLSYVWRCENVVKMQRDPVLIIEYRSRRNGLLILFANSCGKDVYFCSWA